MITLLNTPVSLPPTAPPVDDLLRIYLGQSCGSRAPESDASVHAVDAQELWDYLGDFA
jgi:hypothetical protein